MIVYRDKGLEIFAFPCNQFKSQESKPEPQIKEFVTESFKVELPLFSKVNVNGPDTHQLFQYLKRHTKLYNEDKDLSEDIQWNFGKFLVRKNGEVIDFYD